MDMTTAAQFFCCHYSNMKCTQPKLLFMPPGQGRLLTVPELIGGFACFLLFPLIERIIMKRNPETDRADAKKTAGYICAGSCLAVIGFMYFILHI